MTQEATAPNDNKDAAKSDAFTGTRFLVDATGERQYAVNFKDGKPVQPVRVFSAYEGGDAFKPNEKVFAFDDGIALSSTSAGGITVKATAYQISVGETGRPNNIKTVVVEYEADFGTAGGAGINFILRPGSTIGLRETGFSDEFPKEISGAFEKATMGAEQTAGGLYLPTRTISAGLSFPPQHPQGAQLAREGVEKAPEAEGGAGYKMVDAQTLAETKDIGGGERLKVIFNFEARRVNEIYTAPHQPPAITGHSFAEHDAEAIESAFDKLKELGGEPKPVKRKPSASSPAA